MTDRNETNHDDGERIDELTICLGGVDLPAGEDECAALLDDLGEAVGSILTENYGIHADRVSGSVGPHYTQIDDGCPVCGYTAVEFRDWTYSGNGGNASAFCPECEWAGSAVYRLIDYEARRPDSDWTSAVESGEKTAYYYDYR
jgi:hypothetical protein